MLVCSTVSVCISAANTNIVTTISRIVKKFSHVRVKRLMQTAVAFSLLQRAFTV